MTVSATVHNEANTSTVIASTDVTDGNGYVRGLLDAVVSDPLNRDAEFAIEVHRTHPSVSAFTPNRVVRIIDGDGERGKFSIETVESVTVDGEPSNEVVTIRGRSLLSQWRRVVLRPHPNAVGGSQYLAYNFAYPALDTTSGWFDSVIIADRSALMDFPFPVGWADPYTAGVWSSTQTDGSIFGRRAFTLASTTRVVIYASSDSGFSLWLNGERWAQKWPAPGDTYPVWRVPHRGAVVDLAAGNHVLAVEGRRAGSVGTLWVSMWPTDGTRLGPGDPLILSGPSSNTTEPIGVWKWSCYPASRPAPHCTRAIHDFLSRAQSDGAMEGWSLNFAVDEDSNGDTPHIEEFSIELSRTGYDLLDMMATSGWLDFKVRAGDGKVLDCYNALGSHTATVYTQNDLAALRRKVAL